MSAAATLVELADMGLQVRCKDCDLVISGKKELLTSDLVNRLRQQKPALIVEVQRRERRDELLLLLAANPNIRYAYTVDTGSSPVVIAVAVRGLATCELNVEASKYDPWRLLQWLDDANSGRASS